MLNLNHENKGKKILSHFVYWYVVLFAVTFGIAGAAGVAASQFLKASATYLIDLITKKGESDFVMTWSDVSTSFSFVVDILEAATFAYQNREDEDVASAEWSEDKPPSTKNSSSVRGDQ